MKEQFGNIRKIGKMLHIDCRIYGERVRHASKLKDTPENWEKLEGFLNKIETALTDGTFRYRNFFPRAKQKDLNKFVAIEAKMFRKSSLLPNEVLIREFIVLWLAEEEQTLGDSTKTDYHDLINARINPMIGHLPFSEITGRSLKVFVRSLRHADGPKKGDFLSAKRMRNILTLFHRIYLEACCDYNWKLNDPFPIAFNRVRKIEKMILEKGLKHNKTREVWLLSEWLKLTECIQNHYLPLFELMRTGMIFSELKALKKSQVFDDRIEVCASNSRGIEKQAGKTIYRGRSITLTDRLRKLLAEAMGSSKTEYVFTMADGTTPLNYTTIREDIWGKALKDAKLAHKTMYSLRHTFVGWMVLLGMDSARLKKESGHASRSTLSEDTYGDFRNGLLAEKEDILNFLGREVLDPEEFKKSFPHIYLQENGIEISSKNAAMELSPETMSALASMVATQVGTVSKKGLGIDCSFSAISSNCADNYSRLAS